ncbi:MAG: efflux RND transporter permease subunit, partial [Pseudomonadales bacterium]
AERSGALKTEQRFDRFSNSVLRMVKKILATSRSRIACIVVSVLVSGMLIWTLTPAAEYLPEGEEPKVFAMMNAPPGYNMAAMNAIAQEINDFMLPHVNAERAPYANGKVPLPPIKYVNLLVNAQLVRIISEPVVASDIEALMDAMTAKYREYPGMRAFAARGSIITSNQGGTRSINLDIAGLELDEIYAVAQAAYRRAADIFDNPRIQSQPASLALAQPLIQVHPDWDRAAELGLAGEDIGFIVAAMTDGTYVDEFFLDDDKLDIFLYSDAGRNIELASLSQLPIYTTTGEVVPLGSLAEIVETVDTGSLRRVNGRRTVTLNIIPPRSVALEDGVDTVRTELVGHLRETGAIPAHVDVVISGAADQLDATRDALAGNYLVALLVIYLLMVAIFSHWGYPLLIITTIPIGIAGGMVGLAMLNGVGGVLSFLGLPTVSQPFDMISMLGFLILMGTVVNNPILIVHRAVSNMKELGMEASGAVIEAVEVRLRPIAMSTLTTLFGLAPLVLIPGSGTELYRGVGVIVMFGILGSALVTLTMLPALTASVLAWQNDRESNPGGVTG